MTKHKDLGAGRAASVEKDARWASVVARNAAADGEFYFSVRSTGVYCRPSCKSRLPRPDNVQFHTTRMEAEAAGFRPCKRCRPDLHAAWPTYAAQVEAACQAMAAAGTPLPADELARKAGLSTSHFQRVFKAATGVTPRQYGAAQRARRVRDELQSGSRVTDALYSAGFQSSGRFYATADAMLGMTPSNYRAGGKGAEIRFATGECRLGNVLVARSERGICAILLGDDPQALARDLERRFPAARLAPGDAAFGEFVAAVVRFVEAPAKGLELPLDIQGTAFQQKVWQALRNIPAGVTASYAEIAASIGAPKSARAVAGACAANPLAVAIPCHRVVRGDGGLSGYRWGVERKRALIDQEAGG